MALKAENNEYLKSNTFRLVSYIYIHIDILVEKLNEFFWTFQLKETSKKQKKLRKI